MKTGRIWSVAAILALLGGGCAEKVVISSEPFCKAVTNTCISKDDKLTEKTAQSIEANNLGRQSICGKPTPCSN